MGQHTWFCKDQNLFKKQIELYQKIDAYENGEIWLDDLERYQIHHEINEINENNKAEYHDLFRTNKKNQDGSYTDDIILSKDECNKWLKDNADSVSGIKYQDTLNEFWKKYPKGCIYFG